jgi:hypothetical protein
VKNSNRCGATDRRKEEKLRGTNFPAAKNLVEAGEIEFLLSDSTKLSGEALRRGFASRRLTTSLRPRNTPTNSKSDALLKLNGIFNGYKDLRTHVRPGKSHIAPEQKFHLLNRQPELGNRSTRSPHVRE